MGSGRRRLLIVLTCLALGACVTDRIEDRRFGQQILCHDGDQTLAVSNADSFVHLDHGDALGPCPDPEN
ncbi:MAG: hypothetical protein RQ826_06210 [Xanthomonadales bacterium]|nr:hypothetical protein [Xanthomonadales bacterium]